MFKIKVMHPNYHTVFIVNGQFLMTVNEFQKFTLLPDWRHQLHLQFLQSSISLQEKDVEIKSFRFFYTPLQDIIHMHRLIISIVSKNF